MASAKGEGIGRSIKPMTPSAHNMPTPIIITDRLVLRPLVADDANALHLVFADEELMTYWSSGPHDSVQETRDYIDPQPPIAEMRSWSITLAADDHAIGRLTIRNIRENVAEIGYLLARPNWGRGIGFEAASGLIHHMFKAEDYRRIIADIDPENAGSIALIKRLGFQQEGHLRQEWQTHIGVRDSLIFGLLAEEWAHQHFIAP